MTTRAEFIAKSIREGERRLGVPPGWWGVYDDVRGPGGQRVHLVGTTWVVSRRGCQVSAHDSRASAIVKARRRERRA